MKGNIVQKEEFGVEPGYWKDWVAKRSGDSIPEFLSAMPEKTGYPPCDPHRPQLTASEDDAAAAMIWRRVQKFFQDGTPVYSGLPEDWEYRSHRNMYTDFFQQGSSPGEIASLGVKLYGHYRQTGGNPTLAFSWVVTGLNQRLSH